MEEKKIIAQLHTYLFRFLECIVSIPSRVVSNIFLSNQKEEKIISHTNKKNHVIMKMFSKMSVRQFFPFYILVLNKNKKGDLRQPFILYCYFSVKMTFFQVNK